MHCCEIKFCQHKYIQTPFLLSYQPFNTQTKIDAILEQRVLDRVQRKSTIDTNWHNVVKYFEMYFAHRERTANIFSLFTDP